MPMRRRFATKITKRNGRDAKKDLKDNKEKSN